MLSDEFQDAGNIGVANLAPQPVPEAIEIADDCLNDTAEDGSATQQEV